MESALIVAKELYKMYEEKFGKKMSELKMHKIMYFAQRESYIVNNKFLFDDDFYGWKYGPVLLDVRQQYFSETPFSEIKGNVSSETKELLSHVLKLYGSISSWSLSSLSHDEISWLHARRGLAPSDNGNKIILKEAIKIDADREQFARRIGKSFV